MTEIVELPLEMEDCICRADEIRGGNMEKKKDKNLVEVDKPITQSQMDGQKIVGPLIGT